MNGYLKWALGLFVILLSVYGIGHVIGQSKNSVIAKTIVSRLHDGDIVFQPCRAGQGRAIQLATGSKYSHCGIVFFQKGKPYVLEAVQPVKFTPFSVWIKQGDDGEYAVKRLRSAEKGLSSSVILKMKAAGEKMLGKKYDLKFGWGDDRYYCSELVWKIYNRSTGLAIGPLKKFEDYELSSVIVQEIMKKRYGKYIPYDQKMIAPGDIYESELLETVAVID